MMTSSADTIRILVTTDNHVGYAENDPIRGGDAATTFHEIMEIAKEQDVDMILQGGDLFHISKPSRKSMFDVMSSIRSCCLGDKPVQLEPLNHGDLSRVDEFNHLNYTDPNINVSIPLFAISGNHDEQSGEALLAPMDILAAAGLINHFGKITNNDDIKVTPILIRKGSTQLALYGMSNVRDERMQLSFRHGKVKFMKPDTGNWFNLLAVHQNHISHSPKNYLPETFLPSFMNLVIWGHEHECKPDPIKNVITGFDVIQPGSSVATSLCEAETLPKYAIILSITGQSYTHEKIRLKTVRPFIMKSVTISDSGLKTHERSKITVWLIKEVDLLIEEARKSWEQARTAAINDTPDESYLDNAADDEEMPLPLVRLRVDYSGGYDVENPRRFSNRFVGRVANPNDVMQLYKKAARNANTSAMSMKQFGAGRRRSNTEATGDAQVLDTTSLQPLIGEFLDSDDLSFLQRLGMSDALMHFVDKEDKAAVKSFVERSLTDQIDLLLKKGIDEMPDIVKELHRLRQDNDNSLLILNKHVPSSARMADDDAGVTTGETAKTNKTAARTRASARGGRTARAGRGARASGRTRQSARAEISPEIIESSLSEGSDEDREIPAPVQRPKRSTRAAPRWEESGDEDYFG